MYRDVLHIVLCNVYITLKLMYKVVSDIPSLLAKYIKGHRNIYWSMCHMQYRIHTYTEMTSRSTLRCHEIPIRPWQTIERNLFAKGKDLLILAYYYSNYFEEERLKSKTWSTTIRLIIMKSQFSRHGIQEVYMILTKDHHLEADGLQNSVKVMYLSELYRLLDVLNLISCKKYFLYLVCKGRLCWGHETS